MRVYYEFYYEVDKDLRQIMGREGQNSVVFIYISRLYTHLTHKERLLN